MLIKKCEFCDSTCHECMIVPAICTSCYDENILHNNQCLSGYPDHFIKVDGKCEQCSTPFLDCDNKKHFVLHKLHQQILFIWK